MDANEKVVVIWLGVLILSGLVCAVWVWLGMGPDE